MSVAIGALLWATSLTKAFAALAGVPPDEKGARLLRALDLADPALRRFAQISRWTIIGLTLLALALIVGRLRESAGREAQHVARPRLTSARVTTVLALLLASVLWVVVRPLRAENQVPWPPARLNGEALMVVTPPTPLLDGPDPLERAPVIQVMADKLALDGLVRPLEDVGGMLQTLRTNYQLLQPGTRFRGDLVLVVDRALTMQRLVNVLRMAHQENYDHPMFAFTRAETIVRPMMGRIDRVMSSSARATLIDAYDREAAGDVDPEELTVLRAADFSSYEQFARKLVDLRRAEIEVALDLGRSPQGGEDSARP